VTGDQTGDKRQVISDQVISEILINEIREVFGGGM